jgi:serine/threonine-protein kinase
MCFFSPDGQSLGFATAGGDLKTVRLSDGWISNVAGGRTASTPYGATWAADDRIVFAHNSGLRQVRRSGGAATQLTTLDSARQEIHAFPHALPDGKNVLFGVQTPTGWRIESVALATGERRTIVEQGTQPFYSASGHLAFVRDDKLLIVPFDLDRLEVTGPVIGSIESLPPIGDLGVAVLDMSASGTVVYSPTSATSRLAWVSREGVEQPLDDTLRRYLNPRLSRSGDRVLVQVGNDLWIQDLGRRTFTRLNAPGLVTNGFPIWTSDDRAVHRARSGLSILAADGSGEVMAIDGTTPADYPTSVSSDGETLFFARSAAETSFDIYSIAFRAGAEPKPILQTPAYESGAKISPDGRWLVYVSDDSGRTQVYLRPFPGPDRRWPVSTNGGTQAIWNPNGKEIFYRDRDKMMAVEFSAVPEVTLSPPRQLFEQRYAYSAGITIANYDVTSDGQRFLMVKDESSSTLNVVMNLIGRAQGRAP